MRHLPASFCAFALAAFTAAAVWSWLARPIEIVAVPDGRFDCLSYVPALPSQNPLRRPDYKVPAALIERDLAALKPLTGCVRTYSSYGVQGEVLPVAARLGLQVLLGVWIGADDDRNRVEIDAALEVAARHPAAVRAIVVGNEVLLRREMTGDRLAGIIDSVKARTPHPVAYADIYEFWRRNPVVADAADRLLLHVLPYWDDPTPVAIDEVQAHARSIVERMRATYPEKTVEIGEIGWPSAGRARGGAAPSTVNQARFVREFAAQAEAVGVPYNLIEAIDQPWKRGPEGTVGGFWGILDADRAPKFALSGPVREWPDARGAAIVSTLLAAMFLGAAWVAGRRPGFPAALGIALSGTATATCLWMLHAQTQAVAIGVGGLLWAGFLHLIAAAGGLLLGLQAAGLPAAWQWAPAPLAGLVAACRRRQPTPTVWLGLFRWSVLFPATILSVLMAVDGRHRDFLTLAFVLPALALAMQAWRHRHEAVDRSAETAWASAMLIVAGPLAVDAPGNGEAIAWAGTCLLLASPGVPAIVAELRRLGLALTAERQRQ